MNAIAEHMLVLHHPRPRKVKDELWLESLWLNAKKAEQLSSSKETIYGNQ